MMENFSIVLLIIGIIIIVGRYFIDQSINTTCTDTTGDQYNQKQKLLGYTKYISYIGTIYITMSLVMLICSQCVYTKYFTNISLLMMPVIIGAIAILFLCYLIATNNTSNCVNLWSLIAIASTGLITLIYSFWVFFNFGTKSDSEEIKLLQKQFKETQERLQREVTQATEATVKANKEKDEYKKEKDIELIDIKSKAIKKEKEKLKAIQKTIIDLTGDDALVPPVTVNTTVPPVTATVSDIIIERPPSTSRPLRFRPRNPRNPKRTNV